MNPDIAKERSKASFDVSELIHLLDGGEERTKRRKYLGKYVALTTLYVCTQGSARILNFSLAMVLFLFAYEVPESALYMYGNDNSGITTCQVLQCKF